MLRQKLLLHLFIVFAFSQCNNDTLTPDKENKRWIRMSDANLIGCISIIDNYLWFMGSETIYTSTDHGATLNVKMNGFTVKYGSIPVAYVYGICKDEKDYMYCADVFKGVYRSIDRAVSWQLIGLSDSNYSTRTIISDYNGKLYAGSWSGLYISSDNGITWKNIYREKPDTVIQSIAITKSNSILISTFHGTVKMSTNGGTSWKTSYSAKNIGQLYKSKSGYIYVPSDTILLRSFDGNQWEEVYHNGYSIMEDVAEAPDGSLFIGTWNGLLYSDSALTNWRVDKDLPKGFEVLHLEIDDDGYGYVGSQGKGAYRSLTPLH